MEAGKFVQKENEKIAAAAEEKVLKDLKAAGIHVIDVADKAPWVAACQNTIKSNTASQAELYKQLVDMQ